MASLGNVGLGMKHVFQRTGGYGIFGRNNLNVAVTISGTSTIPGSLATLERNGIRIDRVYTDPSTGVWKFFDVDDSGSQIYGIATYTQGGGATGETWQASVAGSTVVVTKLADAVRSSGSVSNG